MAVQAVSGGFQGSRLIRLAQEQPIADRHENRCQRDVRAPSGVCGSEAEERSEDRTVERILTTRAMSWGPIDRNPPVRSPTRRSN